MSTGYLIIKTKSKRNKNIVLYYGNIITDLNKAKDIVDDFNKNVGGCWEYREVNIT